MQSKKIAIYSGEIPSSTFIERLVEGLAENHSVLLFGFQKKKVTYNSKNIKIVSYYSKVSKILILIKYSTLLLFFDFANKRKLDLIIKSSKENQNFLKSKYYPVLYHKPDIFHLQWAKGVAEWSWVQEFGIKYILSLRGTHITISPYADEKLRQDFIKYFPIIDGFHAVSEAIKNEVLQYGIEPNKIKIIYSGMDLDKFKFNPSTKHHQALTCVSIGRNHWVKGYNVALDCFKILIDQNFDFKYKIIGIDKNAEELIFQKSQLELENNVEFVNQLPFNEVLKTISSADVLLLPSIEEGIANVVLEAMAVGTIVISTNCGGMNEVIVDGKNGFLIPIRNPKAMAEKIIEITTLSNDELNVIRKNARETIEKQHNFYKMINEMEQLYETVCNE